MFRKHPIILGIVILVVIAAAVVLLQTGRARETRLNSPACTSKQRTHAEPSAAAANAPDSIILRLDYAGAEALIAALERDSLSDADVDSLLHIPGLCAMVDNVTRFIPKIGVSEFRADIRKFAREKKGDKNDRYFGLRDVWQARSHIRSVVSAIRKDERRIVKETLSQIEHYRPNSGTLAVTAYFVAGGVSTGFVFEKDPQALYANLVRSDGDLNGVVMNMAHEAYHGMQAAAQERAGIDTRWISSDSMPALERLFAGVLAEGTANYVADPTRWNATGPSMENSRERYRHSVEPGRAARNFALFNDVMTRLRNKRMTWDEAYMAGFTSENEDSFYFVGYAMASALERYCGRECIPTLFEQPPVEFLRRYIALYKKHPEITGRFSPENEKAIETYRTPAR